MVIVSDTVWVTLISTIGTIITALLGFIIAIQSGNRTRLDNIHTLVNSNLDKVKSDLAGALATIRELRIRIGDKPPEAPNA